MFDPLIFVDVKQNFILWAWQSSDDFHNLSNLFCYFFYSKTNVDYN